MFKGKKNTVGTVPSQFREEEREGRGRGADRTGREGVQESRKKEEEKVWGITRPREVSGRGRKQPEWLESARGREAREMSGRSLAERQVQKACEREAETRFEARFEAGARPSGHSPKGSGIIGRGGDRRPGPPPITGWTDAEQQTKVPDVASWGQVI